MLTSMALVGTAGPLKVMRTSNVKDVVATLLGATDAWTTGDTPTAVRS